MGYYFYYPPENKIFVARNAKFFENSLIVQEASRSHGPLKLSGSDKGLELNQEVDTQPSKNTSEEHNEVMPIEVLFDNSPNGRTVGSKWIFKKKTDMDGNLHTFKARLVAKVYTQTYDVDYGETFSYVVGIRAIRILLAIAAFYDYELSTLAAAEASMKLLDGGKFIEGLGDVVPSIKDLWRYYVTMNLQ
ncbi:retrotransposon protein, putative, ty1-copia subclass [Tanacetum coccineum]